MADLLDKEKRLKEILEKITPVSLELESEIQGRLDSLTKPQGSLGRLEELAKRYCLIMGTTFPKLPKKCVLVFAGDHGIVEDGVSLYPQEVTAQMVYNFINGGAAINVLARHVGAEVKVIDMGVKGDLQDVKGLINKKIAHGTKNISKEMAMTREQAIDSVLAGFDVAVNIIESGYDLIATGDMGIGNTTPSSAITSAITGKAVEEVTGRGTGIGDESLANKIRLIKRTLEVNSHLFTDPIGILAGVGGFEIGGICGAIIGAAFMKRPVVVDGFISGAGAVLAVALNPKIRDYIFTSHKSVERGHVAQLSYIGVEPVLDLDMRLGEGTGAALSMSIIDAGLKIYLEMATFKEAKVSEKNV